MAIFLDLENLFGGYERTVSGVQIGKIIRNIERVVRSKGMGQQTATARAYANWGHAVRGNSNPRSALVDAFVMNAGQVLTAVPGSLGENPCSLVPRSP